MEAILAALQRLDLHPVADHFTVGILIVAVLIDLIASLAPTRTWLRYMALSLMVIGAVAAGASYATGDMEADRVWQAMGKEARGVLHTHATLATYMTVVFGVLAVWRILIQAIGFFAGTRPVYLLAAAISAGILIYIGHLGGQLVYTYGVGTALMTAQPTATPTPMAAESLPTVSVPTATAGAPVPTATATITTSPPPAPSTSTAP